MKISDVTRRRRLPHYSKEETFTKLMLENMNEKILEMTRRSCNLITFQPSSPSWTHATTLFLSQLHLHLLSSLEPAVFDFNFAVFDFASIEETFTRLMLENMNKKTHENIRSGQRRRLPHYSQEETFTRLMLENMNKKTHENIRSGQRRRLPHYSQEETFTRLMENMNKKTHENIRNDPKKKVTTLFTGGNV
ncbi:uncharacterized protein LOC132951741 isoform X2 [Metopolophium dirhodum]|uniref:uncharacterized protein LOC132951741 isoform X2 n=1 Tax=Metopolophium dirhodum TaxID=44670 RepID=UPI00299072DE|nr:uncharacterized protein LOC132951741 isoform X2 [Metopolophium dirhodum]